MPILDKNGNVFKLRGPNPMLEEQDRWDNSKLKFINMNFKEEVVRDKKRHPMRYEEPKKVPEPKMTIVQQVEAIPELQLPEIMQDIVTLEPEPEPPVPIQEPRPERKTNKVLCLPVYEVQRKDDLYGGEFTEKKYGMKFSFDALIVEEEDLYVLLFTDKKIPQKSVIYPMNNSRRWWQVHEITPERKGYLVTGVPTSVNPDFTD